MTDKKTLIKEIEALPPDIIDEVYTFVIYLKKRVNNDDITKASESSLAKDWLLPEEDLAWASL